jgi:hypothetical protein
MPDPVTHGDPVDGEPVPETRPPYTLTEWLDSPDGVPVNVTASRPASGSAASPYTPDTAMLLRDTAEVLSRLGVMAGAPNRIVTMWATELTIAARRVDDAEDDRRAEAARRSTRWLRRRSAIEAAVATLVRAPAWRLYRWAQANSADSDWD